MKNITLSLAIAVLLFSSCARYQINMVQSTNVKKDEKTGRFVQENDSVRITYSFAGDNAPVSVEVFNKLDKPLLVDWKRSALVVGDKTISYMPQEVPIKGGISSESYSLNRNSPLYDNNALYNTSKTSGSLSAKATLPAEVSFVPPHSAVSNTPLNIANNLSGRFANILTAKETFPNKLFPGTEIKLNTANFTEAESPFKFRSYLTIVTSDEQPKTMIFEPRFYVSKYINTDKDVIEIDGLAPGRGDMFLLK